MHVDLPIEEGLCAVELRNPWQPSHIEPLWAMLSQLNWSANNRAKIFALVQDFCLICLKKLNSFAPK
jgi:hypothetical protein